VFPSGPQNPPIPLFLFRAPRKLVWTLRLGIRVPGPGFAHLSYPYVSVTRSVSLPFSPFAYGLEIPFITAPSDSLCFPFFLQRRLHFKSGEVFEARRHSFRRRVPAGSPLVRASDFPLSSRRLLIAHLPHPPPARRQSILLTIFGHSRS